MKYHFHNIVLLLTIISPLCIVGQNNSSNSKVTDIDGNAYKTVKIGNQVWMAENLRTTHYRNGDPILTTVPDTLDYRSEVEPKYLFVFNNDEKKAPIYGRLYTWFVATDSRNICPEGWHIPTIEEYKILDAVCGSDEPK